MSIRLPRVTEKVIKTGIVVPFTKLTSLIDMSDEMASGYNPIAVESAWYDWWKKQGYFEPKFYDGEPSPKGVYMIPIPPPNVTGSLHIGHALTCSIQDAMIRWYVSFI
jgi:valyl-tRNA synthetase